MAQVLKKINLLVRICVRLFLLKSYMKKNVIIVAGPTATGKTNYALKLAKKLNGELINADSMQIYKYLDIGTNKGDVKAANNKKQEENDKRLDEEIKAYEIGGIPIHLISFLNPDQYFSVFDFKNLALNKINEIFKKNKQPIIVGGTGLYIDSLIRDYKNTNISKNEELRKKIQKLNLNKLQNKLKKINISTFNSLNESDKQNSRRLIRLIEKKISNSKNDITPKKYSEDKNNKYNYKIYYPIYDWDELKITIEKRAKKMFKDGIVEEVKNVLKKGFKKDCTALNGLGYKEIIKYLNNKVSLNECIELVVTAHKQYARRQRTWFEGKGRGYKLELIKFK